MNWTTIWQLETRGVVLLLLAAAVVLAFRRSTATKRHLIWLCALLTVGCIPLLQITAPRWSAVAAVPALDPMLRATDGAFQTPAPSPAPTDTRPRVKHYTSLAAAPQPAEPTPNASISWIIVLWLAASGVLLVRLAFALYRAWALVRRATPMGNLQGHRVMLADIRIPATVGVFRPVVLMPREATDWPGARQEAVICHEIAHIGRKDWLWQVLAQAICSIYPFNPLAWVALARMRAESELACDDLVIMEGHDPADYAETLLSVARETANLRMPVALVGMARKPEVEDRITSVLDPSKKRSRLSTRALPMVLLGALVLGAAIAGVRAEVMGQIHFTNEAPHVASPKGQVVDADGKPIAGAEIVAMKFGPIGDRLAGEGKSDSDGRFDLSTLALGKDEHIGQLAAVADGHGLGMVQLVENNGPVVITCGEPATLMAGFKTPSGDPASGVRVYVRVFCNSNQPQLQDARLHFYLCSPESLQREFSAVTDSKGIAEIHGLPENSTENLEADDDRYAFLRVGQGIKIGDSATTAPTTMLEPAASFEGQVLVDGKPVSGVKVEAQSQMKFERGDNSGIAQACDGVTDRNGHFILHRLATATYNVALDDRTLPVGWVGRAKEGVVFSPGEHETGAIFELERGGIITGKVDADPETLKSGVQIGIYGPAHPNSTGWVQMAAVKENGTYEARVPSGTQHVYIMNNPDSSMSFAMKEVDVPEGGTATVNFSTADLTRRNLPIP